MLRDFKISQSLLEAEENQNEKIKKKLGFWWEAWKIYDKIVLKGNNRHSFNLMFF